MVIVNSTSMYFLCSQYAEESKTDWFADKHVRLYAMKCLELCWFMNIQSPPIYVDFKLNRGDPFRSNLYKAYVTSGKTVAFVVWPALFLCDGGNVLLKGVAECAKTPK